MTAPVVDLITQTQEPAQPPVAADEMAGAAMFERLVRDPNVDVTKLERLMAMWERSTAAHAKAEYFTAFAAMQGEIPTVAERGRSNNGMYALHEDIVEAVKPVLQRHGFMLTFRTKFDDKQVKVIAVLAHRGGHAEETEFVSRPDTSGNKNEIQALGSAVSYGQRYTTRSLLNIASREDDDNGKKANAKPEAPAPDGYDAWFATLEGVASGGVREWSKAWDASDIKLRNYLSNTAPKVLAALKNKAARAGAR